MGVSVLLYSTRSRLVIAFLAVAFLAGGMAVSQRVLEQVLIQGRRWTNTVVVANQRYVEAYDPIEDLSDPMNW
jgi:hypothetical protein